MKEEGELGISFARSVNTPEIQTVQVRRVVCALASVSLVCLGLRLLTSCNANLDLYFQYVQYKADLPSLKEFTLCMWTKYTNHSNDHPVFSYAVEGQPRAIYSWVSNTERSSYFSLSVNGHTFYRLNYPLRLNRWYHSCQSWNGRTGEWQIWVNGERTGRGFHNRLVGHKIPSGGIAISGQEQTQFGGGFQEGAGAPKGSGGMLGEITMVQLYSVALTAGKAHKDHKHHHVHHFDHNGQPITTPPPPPPGQRPNQIPHPLLTAGQINPALNLNLAQPAPAPQLIPSILPNGQEYNTQFINGQFAGNLVSQQLLGAQQPPSPGIGFGFPLTPRGNGAQSFVSTQLSQIQSDRSSIQPISQSLSLTNFHESKQTLPSGLVHSSLVNPANVQFIDTTNHQLFKRNNEETAEKTVVKRQTEDNNQKKRELLLSDGSIIDDGLLGSYDANLLAGLARFENNQPIIQEQKATSDEREPAEAEVRAVMNVCGGCDQEPFVKALIFGWRSVAKKLYSGAIYSPAVPQCRVF
ncbi:b6 [Carabus blaptoides fortunei]